MPQLIQIEGDLVRIVETNLIREVSLEDLLPNIETRPPVEVGPIPRNTVFMRWDESNPRDKRARFLTELAPGVRNTRYGTRRYTVSIPWTYFLHEFSIGEGPRNNFWQMRESRIFWAKEAVSGWNSALYTALVANCDSNGSICYGDTGVDVTLPLHTRVERLVHEFYMTTFMHDSGTGSPYQSVTGSTTWARWHTETAADPNAWMNFPEWEAGAAPVGRGGMRATTVRAVMNTTEERAQEIMIHGALPPMTIPFTFGRAEEWLQSPLLGPTPEERAVNRHRLFTALQNLHAEDPAFLDATPIPAAVDDDLGGEPL